MYHQSHLFHKKNNGQGQKITGTSLIARLMMKWMAVTFQGVDINKLNREVSAKHRLFRRRASTAQYWHIFLNQTLLQDI